MRGYTVVSEKLEEYIRRTLKVKKADKVEAGVTCLVQVLTTMVEHDFIESALNVTILAERACDGGYTAFSREVRRITRMVWKQSRSGIFADFYSQPKIEEVVCMLAAGMLTKPDILRKREMYTESHSERIARVEIPRYIRSETIRSSGLLAAYVFMIDSCEGALSGAKRGRFYTKELKASSCPHTTAKSVEALFKAQVDWWTIENGEMFGRALPGPLPSEIWYHIRNCMCEKAKKQKNFF